ncbi:phage tail sheath C-terminal domain-containing protein [Streptomyces sp. G-G2]|uniref:phage tail sheath family protein n=1 Tax=Streptomyces sp. G-G2 TaxID=3046201 RepID=UPI0024B9D7C4|nr:phage tail sheath C-terminal domain-containing protein [Streptomyces sp. G-G2]MDJ0385927.1 phage tail sheath C-terminal domain-containing protein [Streptomyces sp. G-G2]
MADSVQYPGVSIEEDASLSLAVSSGATAVPAFIGDFGPAIDGVVRVNSWLDISTIAEDGMAAGAAGGVLRGYFENGGGTCYLVSTAGRTLQEALTAVGTLDDVTILVPLGLWDRGADAAGEQARAVAAHAAGHLAMAILHADRDHDARQARDAASGFKLDADQRAHTALYHPWLIPAEDQVQLVPPVGAVAGAWARVDRERGVWKAPANVSLKAGARLAQKVTDQEHADAQPVNVLREFSGQGTVIWGARTLDDPDTNWRYIPVRRLADMVERDLMRTLRLVTFEPNSQPTWERVRAAADSYLYDIWQQGGLQGNRPGEAYFVQIGKGLTMTDEDVQAGRIVLKLGIAPVRPAEFIILTLTGTAGSA